MRIGKPVARQILRNSQRAVRSAKATILEVIGKQLDDQLRIEGWNSYTCLDRDEARALLRQFYDKADAGRAGTNPTPSDRCYPWAAGRPRPAATTLTILARNVRQVLDSGELA